MPSRNHHIMNKIFNLEGVIDYQEEIKKDRIEIKIGQPRKPDHCPVCGGGNVWNHGQDGVREIKHGWVLGKLVVLLWPNYRYKCPNENCGRNTWTKPPPFACARKGRSYTGQFRREVLRMLKDNSFNTTANKAGVSYSVLVDMLDNHLREEKLADKIKRMFSQAKQNNQKIVLGLDEHSRSGYDLATTVTMIGPKKKLLGVIPQAKASKLREWFNTHFTSEMIEQVDGICMDMTKKMKTEIRDIFNVEKHQQDDFFIIDRYHVQSLVNRDIRRIYSIKKDTIDKEKRKQLPSTHGLFKEMTKSREDWDEGKKEKIEKLFELIPEIKQQYILAEKLKTMYNKCNKPQAAKQLKRIINNLPKLASESRSALTNHFHQILNYFDDRATNGFTEGIHTKVKLVKRISYGIKNLNVYVKKIILAFDELNSLGRVHAI